MKLSALFKSSIGTCGVVWNDSAGVAEVHLPQGSDAKLSRLLQGRAPLVHELPPPVLELTHRLSRHLDGASDDLIDVPVDLAGRSEFCRRVYREARRVRPGQTVTYAELAGRCGAPGSARAVGQAMANNPLPLVIPCHRVLGARGQLGGFSAPGAIGTKLRLLTIEGADLSAVTRWGVGALRRSDPKLGAIIRRVGPYRLTERQLGDHFTTLVLSIVHQQVSMKAGASIFDRVSRAVTRHGARPLDATAVLDTSQEALRGAGLSRQKVSYLRDLATRTATGTLALSQLDHQDDEVIIQSLTQVRGIGRWSAEMFLIFRLGRLNVLPSDDLGLRKAVQRLHDLPRLPDRQTIERLAKPWVPFRSIATWYLWRSLDGGGL